MILISLFINIKIVSENDTIFINDDSSSSRM